MKPSAGNLAPQIFSWITNKPRLIVSFSLLIMIFGLLGLTQIYKDTSADAFIEADNPALLYREKLKDVFGLSDPMVMMVVNQDHANGVFNPATLTLVNELTDQVSALPNVDPDRVLSLATENNITGTQDGMEVQGFFDPFPHQQQQADAIKQAINSFPLYQGTLVAKNHQATMIVAEILNEQEAESTYQNFLNIAAEADTGISHVIHIAGEGAITGYMGSYIDADAQRLNPIAGLVITVILFLTYRTLRGTLLPNVIVLATVSGALGLMASLGIAFFVITNAIPVILIGIAVADSIHVFGQYYEEKAKWPKASAKEVVVRAMTEIWRPITLTTFTTAAGFMGLYFASVMPPFKYMGLFAAYGVLVAWFFSLVFLPAALSLLPVKQSPAFKPLTQGQQQPDWFGALMSKLGRFVLSHPWSLVISFSVIMGLGTMGATRIQVNQDRIDTFHPDEAIYIADKKINALMDGTSTLDIVIESKNAEDLFNPNHLKKIEELQAYVETLPHVGGSTSVVDYIKQMYKSLNADEPAYYRIPDDSNLVAQLFLLYTASNDPTDFEEEIDYDYRLANLRVNMNSGLYTDLKHVIDETQKYIDAEFNSEFITAIPSGRANLNYHWIKNIGDSHFNSVAFALTLVFIMSALFFRSIVAGLFTMIPVISSILLIYAIMAALNISIGVGTSMFASVAIGLGVDFAIHSIDRIKHIFKDNPSAQFDHNLMQFFPTTGRALLFNFLAITLGFGVLMWSEVVPLFRFGAIVALSVSTSFLASMTFLPALIKLTRPAFIKTLPVPAIKGVTHDL